MESIVDLHVIPVRWRSVVIIVKDGFKPIVKDGVKLGGDSTGTEVSDQMDCFRVHGGVTDELGAAGAGAPLG